MKEITNSKRKENCLIFPFLTKYTSTFLSKIVSIWRRHKNLSCHLLVCDILSSYHSYRQVISLFSEFWLEVCALFRLIAHGRVFKSSRETCRRGLRLRCSVLWTSTMRRGKMKIFLLLRSRYLNGILFYKLAMPASAPGACPASALTPLYL